MSHMQRPRDGASFARASVLHFAGQNKARTHGLGVAARTHQSTKNLRKRSACAVESAAVRCCFQSIETR